MRVLDLFSGIGGFSLGLEAAGMHTIGFCEIEDYCRKILRKHWPEVPIHDDIQTYTPPLGSADLICGGYPCQPFSTAGKRKGAADERHLWPEMLRIIRGVRPRWVVAENVAGHIELGFDEVAASLETEGFTVWPFIIPACAVDAQHRRDRLWIVANTRRQHSDGGGIECRGSESAGTCDRAARSGKHAEHVANTHPRQRYDTNEKIFSRGASVEGSGRLMANPARLQQGWEIERPIGERTGARGEPESLSDAAVERFPGSGEYVEPFSSAAVKNWKTGQFKHGGIGYKWESEPAVGRVAHGIPNRVERLKALGNAIVPQIAAFIGQAIMQYEEN